MSNFARKVQRNQLKKQYGNGVFKAARRAATQEKEKEKQAKEKMKDAIN